MRPSLVDRTKYAVELRLHRWAPTLWRHPRHREALADRRLQDSEDNAKTRPGADEGVDLRTVWAVEVYTPAHMKRLLAGLDRLGWERKDTPFRSTPGRWLREMRDSRHARGSYNLGIIRRANGPHLWGGFVRSGPVPDFAETVSLELHQISPSVAMIIAAFHLNAEQGLILDAELRQDRQSAALPIRRGYSISRPEMIKRRAIDATRASLRTSMRAWFSAHLPGAFAAAGVNPPSCELLVLRRAASEETWPHWLDLLMRDSGPSTFTTERWPFMGLRFFQTNDEASPTIQSVISLSAADLASMDMEGRGSDRFALSSRLTYAVGGILLQAGALGVLEVFERGLSRLRDAGVTDRETAAARLRMLETLTLESFDLASVARDFQAMTFEWGGEGDEWFFVSDEDAPRTALSTRWTEWIAERAAALLDLDGVLKSLIVQHGNLLTARENLNLQKSVWGLAIATGFLSLITVIEPAGKAIKAGRDYYDAHIAINAVPSRSAVPVLPPTTNTTTVPPRAISAPTSRIPTPPPGDPPEPREAPPPPAPAA